jgi:hypothetical protein
VTVVRLRHGKVSAHDLSNICSMEVTCGAWAAVLEIISRGILRGRMVLASVSLSQAELA